MENNNEQKNKINEVLKKIKNNEIVSHSKVYFTFKLALLVIFAILAMIVSVFIFSFILFSLKATGQSSLIGFGEHGSSLFLAQFPWGLLILDIIFILILGFLLRSFKFGYKSPLLYLVLGALIVIVISGIIVEDATPFHPNLLHHADHHELPLFGKLYENVRRPPPPPPGFGLFRGVVDSISSSTPPTLMVTLEDWNATTSSTTVVILPESEEDEEDDKEIEIGDKIFIEGKLTNGQIQASHIRTLPSLDFR